MGELSALRREVLQANLFIAQHGLVPFTWGNASGIHRERGLVAIKPSGVPYEKLTEDSMVVVDLDGKAVEGGLSPSTDLLAHLELYRAWDWVGGVVHTHSTWATVWAQAVRPIPCLGTTHADHFRGEVPVAEAPSAEEIARSYESAIGRRVVRAFLDKDRDPRAVPAVLCAWHGPFAWGKTPLDAAKNAAILEECARMAFLTLGIEREPPAVPEALLAKHYGRKHGPEAYYGQKEKAKHYSAKEKEEENGGGRKRNSEG